MIRLSIALSVAALVAVDAARAQDSRNIPAGSPFGAVPVTGAPGTSAPGAIDPGQAWLRAQQAAVARARARERQEPTQPVGFSLQPAPAPDVDLPPRAATDLNAPESARTPGGPLPTPFGNGVRPPWSANGITTPWPR